MTEEIQEKYICPLCSFESNGPGECPVDDEALQRVCDCGSEKFSIECCQAPKKAEGNEKAVAAEVKAEVLEERLDEAEIIEEEGDEGGA